MNRIGIFMAGRLASLFLVLAVSSGLYAGTLGKGEDKKAKSVELTADGPYVIHQPDGSIRVIRVDGVGSVCDTVFRTLPEDFCLHVADHRDSIAFDVSLHGISRPQWKYPRPERVFVMSDPHGRLDCVVSLLQGNGVIDEGLHWSFGANHLVVIGDVFDRGEDVPQIFWLFYKLEEEAVQAGGRLSLLLGNHETLVLAGDLRYVKPKYKELARQLGMDYERLFGLDTELGRWLATRNTVEVIGPDLYVHAGLGRAFYDRNLDLPRVNEEMSRALFLKKAQRKELSELTAFLYGNEGPVWYRGLVRTAEKYKPLAADSLQLLLQRYGVERIIVGHTIFEDVSTFYGQRVIGVNVDNEDNRREGRGRGLLIDGTKYLVVGDKGVLRPCLD